AHPRGQDETDLRGWAYQARKVADASTSATDRSGAARRTAGLDAHVRGAGAVGADRLRRSLNARSLGCMNRWESWGVSACPKSATQDKGTPVDHDQELARRYFLTKLLRAPGLSVFGVFPAGCTSKWSLLPPRSLEKASSFRPSLRCIKARLEELYAERFPSDEVRLASSRTSPDFSVRRFRADGRAPVRNLIYSPGQQRI